MKEPPSSGAVGQPSGYLDRSELRATPSAWTDTSAGGMVVSAHFLATEAGRSVLAAGGNAFDAAIAVSLALAVCESAGSSLGGMGMAVCHEARTGRTFTVESPCRAPRTASPAAVASTDRYRGYAAVATPGLCAALLHIEQRYALLPRPKLFEFAIGYADAGIPVTRLQSDLLRRYRAALDRGNATHLFFTGGEPPAAGSRLTQPRLATTLRRLRDAGLRDFYMGDVAAEIVRDMNRNGGFVAGEDLRAMLDLRERAPLTVDYDSAQVATLGPPGGGLPLCQMLAFAESLPVDRLDMRQPEGVVAVALLIRRARRDRIRMRLRTLPDAPGDAAILVSREYADAELATALEASVSSSGETSHFCTADREGNWVSMTQSIERSFGSGCASSDLGFLYNGYLRAFKVENRHHPYFLRPGLPARSNAAPALALRDGRPRLAIGSTGSERMQSGIFEVLLRLRHEEPFEAVVAPRLHATPEAKLLVEAERFSQPCVDALRERGFEIDWQDPFAFSMGGLQLLLRAEDGYVGVSEPRRDGAAMGV